MRRRLLLALISLPLFAQLPDPKLTPGAVLNVSVEEVCRPGYAKKARHVTASTKRYVFRLYGIKYQPKAYEVDHLINLSNGGANTVNNLFPQPYAGHWGARKKDRVENMLHSLVCSGDLDLKTAQREIATDWVAAYRKYVHTYSLVK